MGVWLFLGDPHGSRRSGRASRGPILSLAATPTPWTACTVWPEKVRGAGPWRGWTQGRGGPRGGVGTQLPPSSGRGSEEAVLGCDHGVQSRDVGDRGPGRAVGVGLSGNTWGRDLGRAPPCLGLACPPRCADCRWAAAEKVPCQSGWRHCGLPSAFGVAGGRPRALTTLPPHSSHAMTRPSSSSSAWGTCLTTSSLTSSPASSQ